MSEPLSRTISAEQVAALLAELAPSWSNEIDDWFDEHETFRLVEGGLRSHQLWVEDGLVIVGDVELDDEVGVFHEGALLVIGAVRCLSMTLRGSTLITGDVHAAEWIFLDASNDYAATIGGTCRAKLVVERGMAMYAERFAADVWRTMNAVMEGASERRLERRSHEACTWAAAAATGLDGDALENLAELYPMLGPRPSN